MQKPVLETRLKSIVRKKWSEHSHTLLICNVDVRIKLMPTYNAMHIYTISYKNQNVTKIFQEGF